MNQLSKETAAERDARIAELTRAHMSASQIAVLVGVTPRSVVRARRRTGVAQPNLAVPMTADEIRTAAAMLDDGASYAEVSRTLGRTAETLRKHLPGRSVWKAGDGTVYRHMMARLDALTAAC